MRKVTLFAVVLLLCGCASKPPAADQITKIVISVGCLPPCVSHQTVLTPDGRYTYSDFTPGNEERGPLLGWPSIVKQLMLVPFFAGRSDYSTLSDPNRETTVYVAYGSSARSVTYDTNANDVVHLRQWVQYVDSMVDGERFKAQSLLTTRLTDYAALQSVDVQRNGCYGWCPRYVVTFNRDRSVRMRYWFPTGSPAPPRVAISNVDFRRIIKILRETQFWTLQRHYPFRAIDTESVGLVFRYTGFTYSVAAPDSTMRPLVLNRIIARVDQLVEDLSWQPNLPDFYQRPRNY